MQINSDKLIDLVQQRRALYDTTYPQYSDKNVKVEEWKEVCAQLIDDWEILDGREKIIQGKEVQKRWNSLRDYFRKELLQQMRTPSGSATKKRRKYIYYDQLLFLVPHLKVGTQLSLNGEEDADDTRAPQTPPLLNGKSEELQTQTTDQPTTAQPTLPASCQPKSASNSNKKKNLSTDEETLNVLKEGNRLISQEKKSTPDDDEYFLLSLMPSFKKYDYEKKIMLRMEILNTILKFNRFYSDTMDPDNIMPPSYIDHDSFHYDPMSGDAS